MKIKAYYNKSLAMTPGKIASQVVHAILGLKLNSQPAKVIVLEARGGKLRELSEQDDCYSQYDLGYTEVECGQLTAVATVEFDGINSHSEGFIDKEFSFVRQAYGISYLKHNDCKSAIAIRSKSMGDGRKKIFATMSQSYGEYDFTVYERLSCENEIYDELLSILKGDECD